MTADELLEDAADLIVCRDPVKKGTYILDSRTGVMYY